MGPVLEGLVQVSSAAVSGTVGRWPSQVMGIVEEAANHLAFKKLRGEALCLTICFRAPLSVSIIS